MIFNGERDMNIWNLAERDVRVKAVGERSVT